MGLTEACPRCGSDGLEIYDDSKQTKSKKEKPSVYDARKSHLNLCVDVMKHRAYKRKLEAESVSSRAKAARQQTQEEAQQLATWEFLGGDNTQLWLLDDVNLKKKAKDLGISESGSKVDLIDRIVRHDVCII